MTQELIQRIESLNTSTLSEERKLLLRELIEYLQGKIDHHLPLALNFICTHNSRRSQLSQAWAFAMGHYYRIPLHSYSGGVEITACNERTIASLERMGFEISHSPNGTNPIYTLRDGSDETLELYSKLYDDSKNPQTGFAAIMTCSSADEGCPFIAGAEKRIPLRYEDPKSFDDTPWETQKYDERSLEIASELKYVFCHLSS